MSAPDPDVIKSVRRTIVFGGEEHSGWLPEGAAPPLRTPEREVSLVFRLVRSDGDAVLLEWAADDGADCGDTWHRTYDEALTQAEAWFGIKATDWLEGDQP
jgi:hypothetical protein